MILGVLGVDCQIHTGLEVAEKPVGFGNPAGVTGIIISLERPKRGTGMDNRVDAPTSR